MHLPDGERAEEVRRRCFERGLLLETCGRADEVLKVTPPLTATEDELERGLAVLTAALAC